MDKEGSTGNLIRHLKLRHLDKINPSIAKQAEFMKKFSQEGNKQVVSINLLFVYFLL